MRKSFMIFLIVLISMVPISAFAGSLEPPTGPAETNSYSLEDVYNRLDTGAAGTQKAFTEPATGPAATGYTINQLMGKSPAKDAANGAGAADVVKGKTFWGETWGTQTGAMETFTKEYSPGAAEKPIDVGFHDGSVVKGDANLVPENIGKGVAIFGVTGTANLSTGDALPVQVLKEIIPLMLPVEVTLPILRMQLHRWPTVVYQDQFILQ